MVSFEVVWELVVLALLLLLQVVGFVAFTLAWETRQLLLRLRNANPTSRQGLLVLTSATTCQSYFLVLYVLVVFDG